jgi:hypothetical protein
MLYGGISEISQADPEKIINVSIDDIGDAEATSDEEKTSAQNEWVVVKASEMKSQNW